MAETTLEFVKRCLDSELQSDALQPLPGDFYARLSQYSQRLKRAAGSGNSEAAVRLISRQTSMIESMAAQLFEIRARKAAVRKTYHLLLPEERYVCSMQQMFQRRKAALLDALLSGKPSFIDFARRSESVRNTTVRFVKKTSEMVGSDLRRYGPFEVDDVASIPASSADILIAGGDAVEVYTREDV